MHVGHVIGDWERGREWVPICGTWPRTDTVFWSICGLADDVPTSCLRCLIKEFT